MVHCQIPRADDPGYSDLTLIGSFLLKDSIKIVPKIGMVKDVEGFAIPTLSIGEGSDRRLKTKP